MRLGLGVGVPMPAGVGLQGFTPHDLSPVLWLDASDTSTITESGGAVSQWDDKSGNGYDVVQASGALQPTTGASTLNGLNILDFNGTSAMAVTFASALAQPGTVFAVAKAGAGASTFKFIIDGVAVNNRWIIGQSGSVNWTAFGIDSGVAADTAEHLFVVVANTTSSVFRIDGAQVATGNAGTASLTGVTLGANYLQTSTNWDGSIAEVVIVPGVVAAGQIAATEQYLAQKWGITL